MSNVIRFLESMGGNAATARMSMADYQAAVAALELDEDQRDSLASRDQRKLGDSLNGRNKMFCMIFSPEEKESPESPEQEDDRESPDDSPVEK